MVRLGFRVQFRVQLGCSLGLGFRIRVGLGF